MFLGSGLSYSTMLISFRSCATGTGASNPYDGWEVDVRI